MKSSGKLFKKALLESVIGQEPLIDALCVLLQRHLFKMYDFDNPLLKDKINNLLILGETGSGKTYSVKLAAKALDIPLLELNGKSIAQDGFKGFSLGELIEKFIVDSTHKDRYFPIVFIDEFDKLCVPESVDRQFNYSMHLQYCLLKYIDGTTIPGLSSFKTSNVCWVFAGAFTELSNKKAQIGFSQNNKEDSLIQDLIMFGVMPELVGRISSFVYTNNVTRELLKQIIYNPNSSFNQWYTYLRQAGVNRKEEPNYLDILERAERRKLGVRGLNQIFDEEINNLLKEHLLK